MAVLKTLRNILLPDGWIAAGFVRDAVWDHLHGYTVVAPVGDVDVIWYDPADAHPDHDADIERLLIRQSPAVQWSVKNQAHMHIRNGDPPYISATDAMTFWPETATAVAVRLDEEGAIHVNAPLGLDDLFSLRLVPTEHFKVSKRDVFEERLTTKRWLERYPGLMMDGANANDHPL
jgi:hypothetical protein